MLYKSVTVIKIRFSAVIKHLLQAVVLIIVPSVVKFFVLYKSVPVIKISLSAVIKHLLQAVVLISAPSVVKFFILYQSVAVFEFSTLVQSWTVIHIPF